MIDWKKICFNESHNIFQAMKNLDESGAKFGVVVSSDWILKGVVSDGDIRRGLLNGLTMDAPVTKVMNSNPIIVSSTLSHFELYEFMKANDVSHVPVVDEHGKLMRICSFKEVQKSEPIKNNAVILMVGGLGSRLGELTANCPKPMLKLGDKPILEIIIENLKEYGFNNFFLSVNYKSEIIESYFGDGEKLGVKITYIRETQRLGTAGSLSMYDPINDLPVIVMNGDVLTRVNFSSLIDFHNANMLDVCMCTFRHDYQVPFGVVHIEDDKVVKIVEKPIHTSTVNAGIYTIHPRLLSLIPRNTFFDMPSLLEKIIDEKNRVGVFQVQDYWIDIGRRDDFQRAEKDYKNKLK